MTALVLAALAAASYGAADFSGALAARRVEAVLVTAAVQVVSLLCLVLAVFIVPAALVTTADLAWGATAGLGAAGGLVLFYRALARGPMSVAAALTALWGAAIPVAVGIGLGERPGTVTLIGMALAVPAGALVSIDGAGGKDRAIACPRHRAREWQRRLRTSSLALAAGVGFGLFFVALSRTSDAAGLTPLLSVRVASLAALAVVLTRRGGPLIVPRSLWSPLLTAGILDFAANALYLVAVHRGSLAWVAAVTSLYPVATVLLARAVLDERLAPLQVWGLTCAAVALALVGAGV
jgi:uncharacterized membrane protein